MPVKQKVSVGVSSSGDAMVHTVRQVEKRQCDNPFCIGMALLTAAVATGLVVYSSTAILMLLR